jgi:hypothetical protein
MPSKQHQLINEKTAQHVSKFAARRLFLGNLPVHVTEHKVHDVFRCCIQEALVPGQPEYETLYQTNPIFGVYLAERKGHSRCGFIEFTTMEMCTACLIFDKTTLFEGSKPIQIRRSHYFDAKRPQNTEIPLLRLPNAMIPVPSFNSLTQIFVGGIPYDLTRDQAFELLEQFGEVKSFHMPAGSKKLTNNGYFFFEFVDDSLIPKAIKSLDGFISPITQGRYLNACLAKDPNLVQDPLMYGVPTNKPSFQKTETSSEELWPKLPQRSSQTTPVFSPPSPKNIASQTNHFRTVSDTSPPIPSLVSLPANQRFFGPDVGTSVDPPPVPPPPGFTEQGSSLLSDINKTEHHSLVPEPCKLLADSQEHSNMEIGLSKSITTTSFPLFHELDRNAQVLQTTGILDHKSNLSTIELGGVNCIDTVLSTHELDPNAQVLQTIASSDKESNLSIDTVLSREVTNWTHITPHISSSDPIVGIEVESVPPVSSPNSCSVRGNLFPWMWDHYSRPPSPFDVINECFGDTTNYSIPQQPVFPKTIRRPNATAKKSRVFVQLEILENGESINDETLESALKGVCTRFGTLDVVQISRMPYINGKNDWCTSSVNFHDGFSN